MQGAANPVRRAFAAAADKYDEAALVQRQAGMHLLSGLLGALPAIAPPQRIIDLGCGTGHGLALLRQRWPAAEMVGTDFALPMLRQLQRLPGEEHLAVCADAHALPIAQAAAEMIWSSLVLQWCEPRRFLAEAARVLRAGGTLALSTLGPETFNELRRAFAEVDGYRHTLVFAAAEAIAAGIGQAGLRLVAHERLPLVRHHPSLRSLLNEVRDIGANQLGAVSGAADARRRGLMGKQGWARFERAYEAARTEQGLPLTYDLMLFYAEKQADGGCRPNEAR